MNRNLIIQLSIVFLGALIFMPLLGASHLFDWDEINFAESAREMILTGDYLTVRINFEPFWEKPPLFIWMQVLSMKAFGVNEFAARFPNAVCGVVTLLVLFNIGRKHFNERFGLLWVLAYAGSVLPHFFFKSGIIDPWFNLFIFLGIYFFYQYLDKETFRKQNIILSALFIGLGVMTKGPVAALVFLLTGFVFLVLNRFKMRITLVDVLIYIFVFVFVGGFWFLLQIINGNMQLIVDFIVYQIRLFQTQDAGHAGFPGYHFVVLFFGVFPASVFALKAFKKYKSDSASQKHLKRWMVILFWVVLILFTIVKTKIIHYSSLCYFPLTFMGAYGLQKIIQQKTKWNAWVSALILFIGAIYIVALVAAQYVGMNAEEIIQSGWIKDKFALGNLQAKVNWSGYESLVSLILFLGIVIGILFFRKNVMKKALTIFIGTLIYTNLTILVFVPRIEGYSQRAAIEFYEEKMNEDCYVETIGFKSYADIFYLKKQIPENKQSLDKGWLLNGSIDKPVYFVTKNYKVKKILSKYPQLKIIKEKNGFVFLRRENKN